MRNKEIREINAGSMADIAFLLLIFFLVTTTLNAEWAIERQMSSNEEGDRMPIPEEYLFEVKLNMHDELLVEGTVITLAELGSLTTQFYTNSEANPNMPDKELITAKLCEQRMEEFKNNPNQLKTWQQCKLAVGYFGPFHRLPTYAAITLSTNENTSYEAYIAVQDEIQHAVIALRNTWCIKYFGKLFTELDPTDASDQQKIIAIRQVYPQLISELPTPEIIAQY